MEKDKQISLTEIAEIAQKQIAAQKVVSDLENRLKQAEESLRLVQEEELPAAMAEIGMESFTLMDGSKVTIKEDVYASIPKEHPEVAFDWLREHNLDGIIKTQVVSEFGRGEDSQAQALAAKMQELGYLAQVKSAIHPMTLKAFLRERIENGLPVPMDAFGAYVKCKAIIK